MEGGGGECLQQNIHYIFKYLSANDHIRKIEKISSKLIPAGLQNAISSLSIKAVDFEGRFIIGQKSEQLILNTKVKDNIPGWCPLHARGTSLRGSPKWQVPRKSQKHFKPSACHHGAFMQ